MSHTTPGSLPVVMLENDPVDTSSLPPGGFWFAPGTIDMEPQTEPWSWLEIAVVAVALSALVGVIVGMAWPILRGWPL